MIQGNLGHSIPPAFGWPPISSTHAMRPLPKVCYNILKDVQLKKLLKQHGLSQSGPRSVRCNISASVGLEMAATYCGWA